jgi:hypothetical protein
LVATQTDLELEISSLALVDTHEHLLPEDQWAGDNAKLIERMKEAGESGWGSADQSSGFLNHVRRFDSSRGHGCVGARGWQTVGVASDASARA